VTDLLEPKPQQDWDEATYSYLYDLAETIARSVHRSFPMVDAEDLLQEALMWAVAHPGTLQNYLTDEDENRCAKMISGAMRNSCREYAVKHRALSRGDETLSDDCWYQLGVLKGTGRTIGKRGLLHHVYDTESWTNPEKPESDGVRSRQDPAEGNNWVATLADVSSALGRLAQADRDLIEAHYKNGCTYEVIGLGLRPQVSRETVSKRMDRAIKKVQQILGGPRPRKDPEEPGWDDEIVGTRRAISNSHARALTDGAYE